MRTGTQNTYGTSATSAMTPPRLLLGILALVGAMASLIGLVAFVGGLYAHDVAWLLTGVLVAAGPWVIAHYTQRGLKAIAGNSYRTYP